MFSRLIPLAVAIVLVVGCKKKSAETSAEGGEDVGNPNAIYTIKIREMQKGDKVHIVLSSHGTTTVTMNGKTNTEKAEENFDYTEEILEMSAEARTPTKVQRTYTTAEKSEKGTMRPLSFAGKTVAIERKGDTYVATADNKALSGKDVALLTRSYTSPDKPRVEDLLPKKYVKLNEEWTVDSDTVKKVSGGLGLDSVAEKSSITGKLTKAYSKNGKQWGVIEFHCVFVANLGGSGGSAEINYDVTIEAPIDGSSCEGTEKSKGKIAVSFSNFGKSGQRLTEGAEEQTVTPVN